MRESLSPRLGVLTIGHLTIDSYSSFFSPLLPLLVPKLGLNLTLVGTLVALSSVSSSFSQPLFGLLSDRMRRPWFVAFGPLMAALFMSGLGLASSYTALVALLMLAGLGVSAFHPQAASLASVLSPRRSIAMAIFVSGGTLGFAIGPIYAVSIVSAFGLDRTWLAAIPGILVSGLLLAWFARVEPRSSGATKRVPLRALRPVLRPLGLLYFATVARSSVSYGFMTFLPLYLHARGYGLSQGGAAVSLYLLAGAIGGFVGGWLADRIGARRVIVMSFAMSAPLFFAFLWLPPGAGVPCLVAGAFVLQSSLPVNVVMGQELSPDHSSTISSLLMGAAWGVGAMIIGPIGALADQRGMSTGLAVLSCMLLVGFACSTMLPDVRRRAVVAEAR